MTRSHTTADQPTLPFHKSPPIAGDVYPDSPGYKVEGPSREAADAMRATARTLRARVLDAITAATIPPTADEIAHKLGASILSVRPRVSELRRLGSILPAEKRGTNESGMSATRWKLAPLLPAAFEREAGR